MARDLQPRTILSSVRVRTIRDRGDGTMSPLTCSISDTPMTSILVHRDGMATGIADITDIIGTCIGILIGGEEWAVLF
jgi:hypothetical protein